MGKRDKKLGQTEPRLWVAEAAGRCRAACVNGERAPRRTPAFLSASVSGDTRMGLLRFDLSKFQARPESVGDVGIQSVAHPAFYFLL